MSGERPARPELRLVQPDQSRDGAFLGALRRREPGAVAELFDRHASRVERLLRSVLGPDAELPDLVQQTFLEALSSLPGFRSDAASLAPWLNRVAVYTARRHIRRRRVRRWLTFAGHDELPEPPSPAADPAVQAALERTYRLLDRLPADERLAFSLRFVEGLELTEVAESMGISLATAKRRLVVARERFLARARLDPILRAWVKETGDGT